MNTVHKTYKSASRSVVYPLQRMFDEGRPSPPGEAPWAVWSFPFPDGARVGLTLWGSTDGPYLEGQLYMPHIRECVSSLVWFHTYLYREYRFDYNDVTYVAILQTE
jgi:hypothetical protein